TSKVVAFLLAELGVTKTHSRPYVSNDNPYSESQFKTMKYRPEFPERFGCYQDAHQFCAEFFPWYNHEHHHSGLGYLTPYEVHYGLAEKRRAGDFSHRLLGAPRPSVRYVVGWMLAYRESAELAEKLIEQTLQRLKISTITYT